MVPDARENYESDGSLRWSTWAGYFVEAAHLIRSEAAVPLPLVRHPFPSVELPTAEVFAQDPHREVVAEAVESLLCTRTGPGLYALQGVTSAPIEGTKISRMQLDTEVYLLNTP